MLKQRVIIKAPAGAYAKKEGIVVVIRLLAGKRDTLTNWQCKVLINNELSDWIPVKWLEIVSDYTYPMLQATGSCSMREVV